jgi:hypothetical protein
MGEWSTSTPRPFSRESSSRGKRTAEVAGGTAAVGAIIGAIAGGGKGAAAGGAAGTGAEVVTSGQRVKIIGNTPDLRVGESGPILKNAWYRRFAGPCCDKACWEASRRSAERLDCKALFLLVLLPTNLILSLS